MFLKEWSIIPSEVAGSASDREVIYQQITYNKLTYLINYSGPLDIMALYDQRLPA